MAEKPPDWFIETADLVQYVSGPLEGQLADWPAQIQDGIMKQLEVLNRGRKASKRALYTVAQSRSDLDPDNGLWFVHVLAQAVTVPPGSGPINGVPRQVTRRRMV